MSADAPRRPEQEANRSMALEIWSLVLWADGSSPGAIVERGVQRERDGYDGVYCPDTQNLAPDVYVEDRHF